MLQMSSEFAANVDVVSIYISEAHPTDEWVIYGDDYAGGETACIRQPRTLRERQSAASRFATRFNHPTDTLLIDSMDNATNKMYLAEPERLFVIHGGRIVYVGGHGPFFYDPDELQAFLQEYVSGPLFNSS